MKECGTPSPLPLFIKDRGWGLKRDGQVGRHNKDKQQERPARGCDKKPEDDDHEEDDESGDQELQKATEAMCVDGGASLHTSHR